MAHVESETTYMAARNALFLNHEREMVEMLRQHALAWAQLANQFGDKALEEHWTRSAKHLRQILEEQDRGDVS